MPLDKSKWKAIFVRVIGGKRKRTTLEADTMFELLGVINRFTAASAIAHPDVPIKLTIKSIL